MTKKVRLVTTAAEILTVPRAAGSYYDPVLCCSVMPTASGQMPVVENGLAFRTSSKTKEFPGDDDPDPDRGACY